MNKKILTIVSFFIIFLATFLRFYNLENKVGFNWDQEDTAFTLKKIIVDKKLTLIGTQTSEGGLFMGPLYYYFFVPFFLLFKMDPIAGPVAVSLVGVLTTLLMFFVGKKLFEERVGILASFIYATSYFIISFDQIVWQANFMMLFSLLILLAIFFIKEKKKLAYVSLALFLSLSLHGHFSAIFLFVDIILVWLFFPSLRPNIKNLSIIFLFSLISFLPLIIFNFRHQNILMNNFTGFLNNSTGVNINFFLRGKQVLLMNLENLEKIFTQLRSILVELVILSLFIIFPVIHRLAKGFQEKDLFWMKILLIFIFVPIIVMNFYKKNLSEYYFFTAMPALIILISYTILIIFDDIKVLSPVLTLLLLLYLFDNLSFIFKAENKFSLGKKKEIIRYIISKTKNQTFRLQNDLFPGYNFGFKYLLYFYKANITEKSTAPVYKITGPLDEFRIKTIDKDFGGGLGIEVPK